MTENWLVVSPSKGDHIRVKFHDIYHHGVFVDDQCVVQFGLPLEIYDKPETIKVLITTFKTFKSYGEEVEVKQYPPHLLKRSKEEICQFALSKVGEGGYNIFHNNCEHFASLCVLGESKSQQIEDIYKNVELLLKGLKN